MRSSQIEHTVLKVLAFCVIVGISAALARAGSDVNTATGSDFNITVHNGRPEPGVALEDRLKKTISVEFRKTAIEDVLRIMADQADVDIVKSPKVTGDVTVSLTDVPLEEALNNILSVHGFVYVPSQNMIRIITSEEQAEKPEVLHTQTYEIVYADVTEVVKALDKFKSSKGSVSSIQGTSHIIVTDIETKIREITLFIQKIDRMTEQILVEARIYDITTKDRFDLGVEWQAGRNTVYPTDVTAAGGAGWPSSDPTHATTAGQIASQHAMNPLVRVDPFLTGAFGGGVTKSENAVGALRLGWLNKSIDVDILLRAQKENIHARLLANPRILVLDNETAKIDIISEIPYQQLQESSAGGSIGTTAFREVGVRLEVTPHLAAEDEMVRLKLKPEFSVVTGSVTLAGVGVTYAQPVVDKRTAETTLLVKNGQTVVLGGLRKKDVAKQVNKIPLLGDIPILGNLFKFKGEDTVVSEIIVFITPWVTPQPIMTSNMTEDEQNAYEQTKFKGPRVNKTKAEEKAAE